MCRCLSVVLIVVGVAETSSADILFSQSGNNLLVNIDAPIELTSTGGADADTFGINFEDVFSVPKTQNTFTIPFSPVTSMLTINGVVSDFYLAWGTFVGPAGILDANDFYGYYELPSNVVFGSGTTVSISPGVVTVTDFFSNAQATLPDQPVTTVQLMDNSGNALSAPLSLTAVPEPSCVLLLSVGLSAVCMRRRHQLRQSASRQMIG